MEPCAPDIIRERGRRGRLPITEVMKIKCIRKYYILFIISLLINIIACSTENSINLREFVKIKYVFLFKERDSKTELNKYYVVEYDSNNYIDYTVLDSIYTDSRIVGKDPNKFYYINDDEYCYYFIELTISESNVIDTFFTSCMTDSNRFQIFTDIYDVNMKDSLITFSTTGLKGGTLLVKIGQESVDTLLSVDNTNISGFSGDGKNLLLEISVDNPDGDESYSNIGIYDINKNYLDVPYFTQTHDVGPYQKNSNLPVLFLRRNFTDDDLANIWMYSKDKGLEKITNYKSPFWINSFAEARDTLVIIIGNIDDNTFKSEFVPIKW